MLNQTHVLSPTPQKPQPPQIPFSTEQQPVSLLPVPYQPQPQQSLIPSAPLMTGGNPPMPIPIQNMGTLIPAQPAENEQAVYIPPMYTKPRAIIPTYRAISGLLSVLIVTLLLCVGTGYYVKASGTLTRLGQRTGFVTPPNLTPVPTVALPDPPKTQATGPAYSIINSATTTAKINSQNVATKQDTVFKPGQTIYLTYSVQHPKAPGAVVAKWYTNGSFYQASEPRLVTEGGTGYTTEEYAQPAEGMVELYWNDQLAIRLFFVVR
jgi:hypothetical protein